MQTIHTQQLAILTGDRRPVDEHRLGIGLHGLGDHRIEIHPIGTELGDVEHEHRSRHQPIEQPLELRAIGVEITGEVAAERHDGHIPVETVGRIDTLAHDLIAELDEPADLGIDLDLPAERLQGVTDLAAIATRGRCHDRIADHQQPRPIDALADQVEQLRIQLGIGFIGTRERRDRREHRHQLGAQHLGQITHTTDRDRGGRLDGNGRLGAGRHEEHSCEQCRDAATGASHRPIEADRCRPDTSPQISLQEGRRSESRISVSSSTSVGPVSAALRRETAL